MSTSEPDTTRKPKYIEARTLKGFRDRLPSDAIGKERMLGDLRRVFETFGFVPIETPHMEYSEVVLKHEADEVAKQLYRFTDHGGRDVALRFDLTMSFARFVVQHQNELSIPFKRYAIGNVFRGENPQFGRYREFTQCDFDIVGTHSLSADAEIVQVIASSLTHLGFSDFTIRINNRKIMNGFAASLGLETSVPAILRIIDKLDKIGAQEVAGQLQGEVGASQEAASALMDFIALGYSLDSTAVIASLQPYKERHPMVKEGLEEIEELFTILDGLTHLKDRFRFDLSIARGLGYYTGIVFETQLNALPSIGSVCSGGRYDGLTKSFSPKDLPGTGASVGLDRLLAAMESLGLTEKSSTTAEVLVLHPSPEMTVSVHQIAEALRGAGFKSEVYFEPSALKKQFKYAERKGHPFVVAIKDASQGNVTLEVMSDHTKTEYPSLPELITALKALITSP